MTDIERVRKVVDWLIFEGKARTRKDLAKQIGYTESSFSQIINSKVALSDSFINNLSLYDSRISKDWLLTGKGEMLNNSSVISDVTNHPQGSDAKDQISTLMKVVETLSENERTNSKNVAELIAQGRQQTDNITRLIDLLCQKGVNIESLIDKEKGGLKTSGGSDKTSASDADRANVG